MVSEAGTDAAVGILGRTPLIEIYVRSFENYVALLDVTIVPAESGRIHPFDNMWLYLGRIKINLRRLEFEMTA